MERTGTPWRVIDDEGTPAASVAAGRSDASTSSGSWRTWPVLGGVAAAVGLLAIAGAIVVSGPTPIASIQTDQGQVASASDAPTEDPAAVGSTDRIVVHVAGAVRRPGLVTLAAGSRVADAIDAAGGLGPRVDAGRLGTALNLAARLNDGDRIVIPSRDDPSTSTGGGTGGGNAGGGDSGTGSGATGPVDVNRATSAELEALPGIGPATATKIIAAREERPFTTVDELLERKVLGQATLAKIRELIVVR